MLFSQKGIFETLGQVEDHGTIGVNWGECSQEAGLEKSLSRLSGPLWILTGCWRGGLKGIPADEIIWTIPDTVCEAGITAISREASGCKDVSICKGK